MSTARSANSRSSSARRLLELVGHAVDEAVARHSGQQHVAAARVELFGERRPLLGAVRQAVDQDDRLLGLAAVQQAARPTDRIDRVVVERLEPGEARRAPGVVGVPDRARTSRPRALTRLIQVRPAPARTAVAPPTSAAFQTQLPRRRARSRESPTAIQLPPGPDGVCPRRLVVTGRSSGCAQYQAALSTTLRSGSPAANRRAFSSST